MRLKKAIYSAILLALSSCGIRDQFTFYPDTQSEIPKENIPHYASDVRISTSDGENIQAFLFRHDDRQRRSLVIYFHGNAGNLYHRFEYAQNLYDMHFDVLLVSYRGYGKSTGSPDEEGIYLDGESAINYAMDSLGYAMHEITIFGRSLGTTVAVHISQNREFNGVILATPLTSGKEMATAMGLNFFRSIAGNSYNSLEKINKINSRLLIIHGDQDEVVPYYMGKQIFDKFSGDKRMVTIKYGGHNDLQDVDSLLYWGEIEKFIKKFDSKA